MHCELAITGLFGVGADARFAALELLLARGHSIDEVAPLLHMFPDERHDFFISVANLRALRRTWARMMKETYGATSPEAMACRTTVYGHGQEALAEPLNNIARTAFGTLAYVLGGASYRLAHRARQPVVVVPRDWTGSQEVSKK